MVFFKSDCWPESQQNIPVCRSRFTTLLTTRRSRPSIRNSRICPPTWLIWRTVWSPSAFRKVDTLVPTRRTLDSFSLFKTSSKTSVWTLEGDVGFVTRDYSGRTWNCLVDVYGTSWHLPVRPFLPVKVYSCIEVSSNRLLTISKDPRHSRTAFNVDRKTLDTPPSFLSMTEEGNPLDSNGTSSSSPPGLVWTFSGRVWQEEEPSDFRRVCRPGSGGRIRTASPSDVQVIYPRDVPSVPVSSRVDVRVGDLSCLSPGVRGRTSVITTNLIIVVTRLNVISIKETRTILLSFMIFTWIRDPINTEGFIPIVDGTDTIWPLDFLRLVTKVPTPDRRAVTGVEEGEGVWATEDEHSSVASEVGLRVHSSPRV